MDECAVVGWMTPPPPSGREDDATDTLLGVDSRAFFLCGLSLFDGDEPKRKSLELDLLRFFFVLSRVVVLEVDVLGCLTSFWTRVAPPRGKLVSSSIFQLSGLLSMIDWLLFS